MSTADCKGCSTTVRLAEGEVERILAEYLSGNDQPLVDDSKYSSRLEVCGGCEDLRYGTTCRHCGCLIQVRAKIASKKCPANPPKW